MAGKPGVILYLFICAYIVYISFVAAYTLYYYNDSLAVSRKPNQNITALKTIQVNRKHEFHIYFNLKLSEKVRTIKLWNNAYNKLWDLNINNSQFY